MASTGKIFSDSSNIYQDQARLLFNYYEQAAEQIVKQEEAVEKSKAKYDAEVKKLKDMYAKREEARRKALLDAVEKSSKSYEEIMAFVTARQED